MTRFFGRGSPRFLSPAVNRLIVHRNSLASRYSDLCLTKFHTIMRARPCWAANEGRFYDGGFRETIEQRGGASCQPGPRLFRVTANNYIPLLRIFPSRYGPDSVARPLKPARRSLQGFITIVTATVRTDSQRSNSTLPLG